MKSVEYQPFRSDLVGERERERERERKKTGRVSEKKSEREREKREKERSIIDGSIRIGHRKTVLRNLLTR